MKDQTNTLNEADRRNAAYTRVAGSLVLTQKEAESPHPCGSSVPEAGPPFPETDDCGSTATLVSADGEFPGREDKEQRFLHAHSSCAAAPGPGALAQVRSQLLLPGMGFQVSASLQPGTLFPVGPFPTQ